MLLRQLFDLPLAQYFYLVGCQQTGEVLLIDPEQDVDTYLTLAASNGLRLRVVTETHIDADLISGAIELAKDSTIPLYLSDKGDSEWRYAWALGLKHATLLRDRNKSFIENIELTTLHTPGHTPEHLSFSVIDKGGAADKPMALFSDDFLFVGDVGGPDLLETTVGQNDSMRPSDQRLQSSLKRVYFEDCVQVLPGHGLGSACGKSSGRAISSIIRDENKFNHSLKIAVNDQGPFIDDNVHGQPKPPLYFATIRRLSRDGAPIADSIPAVPSMRPRQLVELMAQRESPAVAINVREDPIAFENAYFPNSLNVPLRSSLFTPIVSLYIGKNESVVLILEEPEDLDLAVHQLYRIGYETILDWVCVEDLKTAGLLSGTLTRLCFPDFNAKAAGKEEVIVDVRSRAEYELSHLTGALSLSYTQIRARRDELPSSTRLSIHCETDKRAGFAFSGLKAQECEVVHVDGVHLPETGR